MMRARRVPHETVCTDAGGSMRTCPNLAVMLAALGSAAAFAQAPALPTEFPPDALPIGADALRERLSGKVFRARFADGSRLRLQFNANGYFFVNSERGFADDGKWRTEDGHFCTELKKIAAGCVEARVKGDAIFYKRVTNGEVVEMTAQ
jgi:hypothetical protein